MHSEETQIFNNITDDDRDRVGIGALIVFIIMVLVVAVATGVLVNTAGFLQAAAEDAGEQSVNKVTNRVEVLNTHGTVGSKEDTDNITLTAHLTTGSDAVDTNEASIKYPGGDSVVTLTSQMVTFGANSATNNPAEGVVGSDEFGLSEVTDDDDPFGVLSNMSDCYEATISTAVIETSDGDNTNLIGGSSADERATLRTTSHTGGATQVILMMPQQLVGKTQNEPVEL